MRIRRLTWAGLEVEADGETAVIDLVEDMTVMEPYVGAPREPLTGPERPGAAALALVTHLHSDHTDPAAVERALGPDGLLLRPARSDGEGLEVAGTAVAEAALAAGELDVREVAPWESVEAGPFRATAVPAVDGFGDPQVSWVLEAGGRRILHAGDTIFHGSWWTIAMRHGPFDAAFLPVNGAVVDLPHRRPPSPLPASMTPGHAAVAAKLLGARVAVPIHYDTLHRAPTYVQVDDPARAFVAEAAARGVDARVVPAGGVLDLAELEAQPAA